MSSKSTHLDIPLDIIDFRPVMKDIENYIFVVEMRYKKIELIQIELPLGLWPEPWYLGGKYSLRQFLALLE